MVRTPNSTAEAISNPHTRDEFLIFLNYRQRACATETETERGSLSTSEFLTNIASTAASC